MQQLTERKHHNNNSKQLSGNFSLNQWYGGIGISLQNKSTNDISKEEHQKIFSNSPTTALPSPLSVVPTPGPHPDTLIGAGSRVSHLLAAGCWLTHQLWSMIQRAADEDSLSVAGTGFWKSIFIVNGKVGQQQQQSGLDESGLVELCWVSEYPPGPINILLH